jgi:GNAT superfamily N-acetyltransferase
MLVEITTREGDVAAALLDVVVAVYAEVYAEPPYLEGPDDIAGFTDAWQRHSTQDGFRLVLGHDGPELVGFAYGHLLPPDTDWWDGGLVDPNEAFTDETGQRTFAVIELAVLKPHRRRGAGCRLHAALLEDTKAERATLLVRPEPETAPARAAYGSWGYSKIGQIKPGPTAPVYDAMLCPLDDHPATGH